MRAYQIPAGAELVGFDETFQRLMSVLKHVAAEEAMDKTSRKTDYAHSLVSTLIARCANLGEAHKPSAWVSETMLLPPQMVDGTDHVSVGKGLVSVLERYFMGAPLAEAVAFFLEHRVTIITIACDQASANRVFVRKFITWINAVMTEVAAAKPELEAHVVAVQEENCSCHKSSRGIIKVTKRIDVDKPLTTLSSIARRKRVRSDQLLQ